jgi:spermidine synthase
VTYVDIDPNIADIVREYYTTVEDDFIGMDARVYVQQTTQDFPVIIVDAYSHELSIPSHLLTVEFFVAVNRRLAPNGHAIFNMVINASLEDPYSRAIDSGLRAVFKHCIMEALENEDRMVNVIYVCERNKEVDLKALITAPHPLYYTDNLNTATWDMQYLKA